MTSITFFTIPRASTGAVGIRQRNALKSWRSAFPDAEIIVFGNEIEVDSLAREVDAVHVPQIDRNRFGTPLVSDAFRKAVNISSFQVIAFLNSDILLLENFSNSLRRMDARKYLIVARRWEIPSIGELDFSTRSWAAQVGDIVSQDGELATAYALDFFVFPKCSLFDNMPAFAVGRPRWDNWVIYHSRRHKFAVVDATSDIMLVHPKHEYDHVRGRTGAKWEGPEANQNELLLGSPRRIFGINDANYKLMNGQLIENKADQSFGQRWRRAQAYFPILEKFDKYVNGCADVARMASRKLRKPFDKTLR